MKCSLWQLGALCVLLFSSCSKKDEPAEPPVPRGVIVFSSHGTDVNAKDAIGVYNVETNALSDINFSAPGQPFENYQRPRLSRDRSVVYFYSPSTSSSNSDIFSCMADGTGLVNITGSQNASESFASPSPDGSKLLFIMNSTNDPQLWMMNADGSGRSQISNFSGASRFVSMAYPLWSKDGRSVLFSAHLSGEKWNIYSFTFEGARLERLTNSTEKSLLATDLSPDGRKILYVSFLSPVTELYTMNIDGSGEKQLTNFGSTAADASWSPDGNFIAFVSNHELPGTFRNTDLYLMNADGTGIKRLTSTGNLKWDTHWK